MTRNSLSRDGRDGDKHSVSSLASWQILATEQQGRLGLKHCHLSFYNNYSRSPAVAEIADRTAYDALINQHLEIDRLIECRHDNVDISNPPEPHSNEQLRTSLVYSGEEHERQPTEYKQGAKQSERRAGRQFVIGLIAAAPLQPTVAPWTEASSAAAAHMWGRLTNDVIDGAG